MSLVRQMIISAVLLGLFAIIGTAMVALIHDATAERIAANHRAFLLKSLHILVPPEQHDNDLFTDVITVNHKELLGTDKPVRVYRARRNDSPVAAIINSIAPDGYSGSIELLVAIRYDGTLAGVRVVKHKETPGLGDGIEASRSDWILGFDNRSLTDPEKRGWVQISIKEKRLIFFSMFSNKLKHTRCVRTLLYHPIHFIEIAMRLGV